MSYCRGGVRVSDRFFQKLYLHLELQEMVLHTCHTSSTTHMGARVKPYLFFFSEKYDLKNIEFLPGCRVSDRFVVGVKMCPKKLEYICRIG